ncbi:MAG TPA: DUF190 domain-containing protein [Candidatus Moranbacteria bacterium]|nr:DUF190 domain-containing protein [Candidatus Moranbacteria bacterium]
MKQITMVRVYLTESEQSLKKLLTYLHDESQVSGVTVLRGITGFGNSGKIYTASLLDLSLDLPIIVEFFDNPEKITVILSHIQNMIKPNHIVHWQATLIDKN